MPVTGNKHFTSPVTTPHLRSWPEHELSIRIFSDGFSFSTPQRRREVMAEKGETLAKALEKAFNEQALLRPDYDEVNVYADYPSTRIPLDEFRSEEAQALYRLTFGPDSLTGMNMHYEMLPALEIIEVFAINAEIEEIILRYYPHATIHCYFGQLMNRMLAFDKRQGDDLARLYAHSNGRQLLVFSYDKGRLRFANSFEAKNLSNQIYFLLYAWKQLGLRQRKDICVLIGKDKMLEAELKRYLSNVECV